MVAIITVIARVTDVPTERTAAWLAAYWVYSWTLGQIGLITGKASINSNAILH